MPVPLKTSANVFGEAAGLQVRKQALDLGVAVEAVEFLGDIVVDELNLGGSSGFGVMDALLETIEGGAVGIVAQGDLRLGGFVESDAAAMASEQEFAFGFGFVEFLLEFDEGVFQSVDLGFLVVDLFLKTLREALSSLESVKGGTGEVVLAFVDRDFGFMHPVLAGVFLLAEFFLKDVLVGNGDGDLRFNLEVLIFHVEDDLLDHFFRILGAVNHVVEVGAD
jgi:hypothetical protein